LKSNVSELLEVARCVYIDACAKCIADVSDFRDLKTIRSRVEQEGLSFLTITLPQFARDFERSLANGGIDSSAFAGFAKVGAIPAFLQGMLSLLFDKESGCYVQRSNTDRDTPVIVDSVRQICLCFKKLELACTPKRVRAAITTFVQVERDLEMYVMSESTRHEFDRVSRMLWPGLLGDFHLDKLKLRHGPGATADGRAGNGKFVWQYWHDRLEPYFPLIDSGYSISAEGSEELGNVSIMPADLEWPVKVTPVPKTLKGPRIIAVEPCCMQYAQQGIRDELYARLESFWLTEGHVNFRDQSVNQQQAMMGSKTGQCSTIDLSEASDRVPRSLAMSMFDSNPDLRDAIDACRSTHAKLPDGTIVGPMEKFASMGSALCFPIESMYFYTVCVVALLEAQKLACTQSNIFIVTRDVYVYGDDIIVPTNYAITVLEYLQKYYCKVNISKTFFSGSFRESCGMDAFEGEMVNPVYVRQSVPESRQQASELISWVAIANLFYKKGFWHTASHMFDVCEKHLGSLPYVSETSPVLGRISFLGFRSVERWNREYHTFEIKGWVPGPVYRTDRLEGYAALQKSLSRLEGLLDLFEVRDPLHLERSARHGAVALQRRWALA